MCVCECVCVLGIYIRCIGVVWMQSFEVSDSVSHFAQA